jgi:hypothetical protein
MGIKSISPKINKTLRQRAFIEALIDGSKTITQIDEFISNRLKIDYLIPEATRNRDIKDLRQLGYQIDLNYKEGREPEYILRKTKIEFFCEVENILPILQFLQLGSELGVIDDKSLNSFFLQSSKLLKKEISSFKIEGLRKMTNLIKQDLNSISKAIDKNCSITFYYKQPSDSRSKAITGYPKEIILQDKFLYLTIKRKNSSNKSFDWRDYRLDRFIQLQDAKMIKINKKDIDPFPQDLCEPSYLKILVKPPLKSFFEPGILGLTKIFSSPKYDIYDGYIYKSTFRIIKDILPLLPHIEIIENEELRKNFLEIIEVSYLSIKEYL